jgi:hypothetical protein
MRYLSSGGKEKYKAPMEAAGRALLSYELANGYPQPIRLLPAPDELKAALKADFAVRHEGRKKESGSGRMKLSADECLCCCECV